MSARLHVMLGAGGVGKTTLAAGYALALGRAGAHVGLLGIDPARRLASALGLALPDLDVAVPAAGDVRAALLSPADCMRRWAGEACPDPADRARLLENPFFLALADRLAASSDLLAAVRLAEWAERDPHLTDLVVDTAPGLSAIEFLRRPRSLAAFVEGRLVGWLRWLARPRHHGAWGDALGAGARRAASGLARIGGVGMVQKLAEFLALVEGMLAEMLARVARAEAWLREESTEILLVTAVRDDAADTAAKLAGALRELGLAPRAIVVNRALPDSLGDELAGLSEPPALPDAVAFLRHARALAAMQRRVVSALAPLAPSIAVVPAARGLDEEGRLDALAVLGERLRVELARSRA